MSEYAISRDSNSSLPRSLPEPSTKIDPVLKVINILELCEQILEYLPCADLRNARLVCHQFNAVINQSTLMRQRSSLRIPSNQIFWAAPTDTTLLTGIYAEDHIAAAHAKGQPANSIPIFEMHPYLKVDHGTSHIGHRTGEMGYMGHFRIGNHKILFGDNCLTEIPDDLALDDVYISQPPAKYMYAPMSEDGQALFVDNEDGITFGDVRRAVKEFVREGRHDPDFCQCTTTVTVHERNFLARWKNKSSPDRAYDYHCISFDCAGILIVMASIHSVRMASENYVHVVNFCCALCLWLLALSDFFPLMPSITVPVQRRVKGPETCKHALDLSKGVPVTAEERLTLEKIGVVTEDNDPEVGTSKSSQVISNIYLID